MDLPDFDDMPIGLEDINQSQQKVEEIVANSDSEIIGESYDVAGAKDDSPNTGV